MSTLKPTDVSQVIAELKAGTFEKQVGHALSEVALGVVAHNKSGKVVLTFDVKRVGDGNTINIEHTLAYTCPTSSGKRSEETTGKTPMTVNNSGNITLFPENQADMFMAKSRTERE